MNEIIDRIDRLNAKITQALDKFDRLSARIAAAQGKYRQQAKPSWRRVPGDGDGDGIPYENRLKKNRNVFE